MHNVLDACISITSGSGRGLGPGIPEFLGTVKWERADSRVPSGAPKNDLTILAFDLYPGSIPRTQLAFSFNIR